MGRPTKETHERRSERLNLRLTPAEREYIRRQAELAGIPESEYTRRLALGCRVVAAGRRTFDPALVSEINRVGVNVNQLARAVHTGREFVTYWRQIGDELKNALAKVVRAGDS